MMGTKKQLLAKINYTVILCILFLPGINWATPVPDTGQTVSGTYIFGEDSDYNINSHSYTKLDLNGNALPDSATTWAMVQDNVTKLIWEVKTDDSSIHDRDNTYNWNDAQNVFIKTLNDNSFGEFNDWRIPTVKELAFIIDRNGGNPSIDTSYFPNTQSSYYLVSNGNGWYVYFGGGIVSNYFKPAGYYVRAVRGMQTTNHFVDYGDGTVTDTDTGLMWQQIVESPYYPQWENAISYCERLVLAGYDDWRLPNINELLSIVREENYPAIDQNYFPGTKCDRYYWSSTFGVGSNWPRHAWHVDFADGEVHNNSVDMFQYVRAVRGGKIVTVIELSGFIAIASNKKVTLRWSTESEIDNAGFNIYRAVTQDGEYIKINDSLIPAKVSSTQGASYEFIDREVKNRKTYYYKLEDIDLNGSSTMHGPVSATPRWVLGLFGIFKK